MKRFAALLLLLSQVALPQSVKYGKWLNVTEDIENTFIFSGGGELIISEDYEVTKTHEICARVDGFYFEKSGADRYEVNFKGMRTSATFTFTDRRVAEKWAEKWCTPESLLSIRAGHGDMGRKY